MISYEPLYKQLVKKNISVHSLMKSLGMDRSSAMDHIMSGSYVSLETLDRICKELKCKIQDVIEWKPGEKVISKPEVFVTVNWDILFDAIRSKYVTLDQAAKKLGRSVSYFPSMRYRTQTKRRVLVKICKDLELDYNQLLTDGLIKV